MIRRLTCYLADWLCGSSRQAAQAEESRDRVADRVTELLQQAVALNAQQTDTLGQLVQEMQRRDKARGARK